MMKSFFKKLAFVMALAMVVTLAAPAAQASAATNLGIAPQWATSVDEVVTEYNIEVGETVDFKYYYAPKNYKELNPTWVCDSDAVTYTQKGEVTGVKDGVAVVLIKLDNGQVGTVKVTVGKGDVPVNGFVAKQTTENDVQLTFNNKAITKEEIAANLKVFYVVSGYDVEVSLIKSISDVKDGVATVEVYGTINDGSEYKFEYKGETSGFVGKIGAVASIEVKVADGKYVGDDIKLGVVCRNAEGIDITEVVNNSSAYITYTDVQPAQNNEFWLSGDTLYFTTEAVAYVKAEYHGYDANNNELPVIPSDAFAVVAKNKPAYTLEFNAAPEWTIADTADWKNTNKKIAVGDDSKGYTMFIKTKEVHTEAEVVFPTANMLNSEVVSNGATVGTYRFVSTRPSVLYITENTGLMMPNSDGTANVLLYFTPDKGSEVLVAAINVTVSKARAVTDVKFDGANSATLSTVEGYNKATFKLILKDGLDTAFEGAKIDVKCTTKPANGLTAPTPVVSSTKKDNDGNYVSNSKGEISVTVEVNDKMVADASTVTYWFDVTVNGIVKKFSVTIKDPKGTAGAYQNLSYGLYFGGNKEIKVENTTPLTLTANLAVLSNGAAVGNQTLVGPKVDIEKAELNGFYYEVKFNNEDITNSVTTTATNSVLNMALTKTATSNGLKVVDYTSGVGTYTVTIYKATAKNADPTKPAYYAAVKTLTQEVKAAQPALKLVPNSKKSETTERNPEEIVKSCFKFQYDGKDITDFSNYILDVDTNNVAGASICYINSVTFYKNVGGDTYVKYTVDIKDYVNLK